MESMTGLEAYVHKICLPVIDYRCSDAFEARRVNRRLRLTVSQWFEGEFDSIPDSLFILPVLAGGYWFQ